MTRETISVAETCTRSVHDGLLNFPEIVGRLLEAGFSHYHVDYLRQETTYYHFSGDSHIVPLGLPSGTIAQDFDAPAIRAAVLSSQTEGQPYQQFLIRSMNAGCIGYIAYLTGKRVTYVGRLGDEQIEYFPGFDPTR